MLNLKFSFWIVIDPNWLQKSKKFWEVIDRQFNRVLIRIEEKQKKRIENENEKVKPHSTFISLLAIYKFEKKLMKLKISSKISKGVYYCISLTSGIFSWAAVFVYLRHSIRDFRLLGLAAKCICSKKPKGGQFMSCYHSMSNRTYFQNQILGKMDILQNHG